MHRSKRFGKHSISSHSKHDSNGGVMDCQQTAENSSDCCEFHRLQLSGCVMMSQRYKWVGIAGESFQLSAIFQVVACRQRIHDKDVEKSNVSECAADGNRNVPLGILRLFS